MRIAVSALLLVAVLAAVWFLLETPATDVSDADGDLTPTADEVADGGPGLHVRANGTHAAGDAPPPLAAGRVVNASGAPLSGVRVELRVDDRVMVLRDRIARPHAPRVVETVTTDALGRFGFRAIPDAILVEVHAHPGAPWVSTMTRISPSRRNEREIVLVARRGHPLRGRVLGLDGKPVQASVSARGGAWSAPARETAADGSFQMGAVPAGVLSFDVTLRSGSTRLGIPVLSPAADEVVLDLSLAAPATVAGTVRDAQGAPVVGAHLAIEIEDPRAASMRWLAATTSGDDGSYRLTPLQPGRIDRVIVRAPGYVEVRRGLHHITLRPHATLPYDVSLAKGAVLEGRVADREGAPVADAMLHVKPKDDAWSVMAFVTRTEPSGRYRIDGLPSTFLRVQVFADGLYQEKPGRDEEAYVQPPGATIERNFVMAPGSPVSGVVVDGNNQPVAGMIVRAQAEDKDRERAGVPPVLSGATGDDGTFELAPLDPRTTWHLTARNGRWMLPKPHTLLVEPGASTPDVRLVVKPLAHISGVVVDEAGSPVTRGIEVKLADRRVVSDGAGRFDFGAGPAGTHRISTVGGDATTVTVTWGEVLDDVRLGAKASLFISGIVVDEEGKPVAGVSVETDGHGDVQARTDAGGAFRLGPLPRGPHNLSVDHGESTQPVPAGTDDARLVWRSTEKRIEGRILGPDGQPVPQATVTLWLETENEMSGDQEEASGGWFAVSDTIEEFDGKRAHIMVERPRDAAGVPLDLQPTMLMDVDLDQPIVVRMERGASLGGHVFDDAGKPLAGVRLRAKSKDISDWYFDNDEFHVLTDEEGAFRFIGVPSGTVKLDVYPPPVFARPKTREIPSDSGDVEYRLTRGGILRGTVTLPSGRPAAWAIVRVVDGAMSGSRREATADEHGRFMLEGLGEDGVTVKVEGPRSWGRRSWPYLTRQVRFKPGANDVKVALEAGGFLECTVWREGERLHRGTIKVYKSDGSHERVARASVSRNKPVLLGPLKPGDYFVIANSWGSSSGRSAPLRVTCPDDDVRIDIAPYATLTGRIENAEGQAHYVRFFLPPPGEIARTKSKDDGTFEFNVVQGQVGMLYAWRGDSVCLLPDVRPSEGPFSFVMREGGKIGGRVEFPVDHDFDERVYVNVEALGHSKRARVGKDGLFTIKGLLPVPYKVSWTLGKASQTVQPGTLDLLLTPPR